MLLKFFLLFIAYESELWCQYRPSDGILYRIKDFASVYAFPIKILCQTTISPREISQWSELLTDGSVGKVLLFLSALCGVSVVFCGSKADQPFLVEVQAQRGYGGH